MIDPKPACEARANESSPPLSPQWARTTRYLVTVGLVIFGIWVLTLLTPVLTMLVISFIISFLMYRPATILQSRLRLPWALAVILLYLAAGFALTLAVLLLIPEALKGFNILVNSFEGGYADLQKALAQPPEEWEIALLGFNWDLNPLIEPLRAVLTEPGLASGTAAGASQTIDVISLQEFVRQFFNFAATITNFLTRLVGGVAGLFTAVLLGSVLSLLILLDMPGTRNLLYRLTNPAYRREIALLVSQLQQTWWAFFRGQVVLALIVAVLTYIQLGITGISGALLFAILTGVLVFIPAIGGFIALIPQVAAGFLTGSSAFPDMPHILVALLVILGNIIISQLVWNIISPKILGDALKLPTAVVICAVFVGAALGGLLGAFLIVPLASSTRIVINYLLHKVSGRDPFPDQPAATPESEPVLTAPQPGEAPA